jgi:hypothetical protein
MQCPLQYSQFVPVSRRLFLYFHILIVDAIAEFYEQWRGRMWLGNCACVCSYSFTLQYFVFNLLKPTGHVMHQQFNIQQLYVLPTLYLCVLYLSENKQRLVSLIS